MTKHKLMPPHILSRRSGFSLMELIIVVIIIGILAAIAIPRYTGTMEQRRGESCANNMRVILSAWRIYNMTAASKYEPTSRIFHNVSWINNTFGTNITEKYFGRKTGTPGFFFLCNPSKPWLRLWAFRNNKKLQCTYWYQRTKNIWRWGVTWPWLPENE